ncbi:MAG: ROK family protein [Oscillospiraceae bacterium]|jgi:glucokinase|nr:ROK family protein [Oscillospiraceae bacterium]
MFIGLDIGGTGIDAGLVTRQGELVTRAYAPVSPSDGQDELIGKLRRLALEVARGCDEIEGIGVGVPGAVDGAAGRVLFTSNLPLGGADLGAAFKKDFGNDMPVYLDNDANCAALGEARAPGREAVRHMVFVTIGTGLGGGIIIDGKPYGGFNGAAGEIGHVAIARGGRECPCGRRGCWEQYASATGIVLSAREAMEADRSSAMWKLVGGDLSRLSAKTPFDAARAGDATATAVVREFLDVLAFGLTNLVNTFQPELLVLGGGVSREGDDLYLNPLRELVARDEFRHGGARCRLEKAVLGADAGVIGAALLGR